MKYCLLSLIILLSALSATAQESVFDRLENTRNIQSVYISSAMIRLGMDLDVVSGFENIAGKLDCVRIFSSSDKDGSDAIVKEMKYFCPENGYDNLMRIVEPDGEKVQIFTKSLPKGKNEFVLLTTDGNEANIIYLLGNISQEDFRKSINH